MEEQVVLPVAEAVVLYQTVIANVLFYTVVFCRGQHVREGHIQARLALWSPWNSVVTVAEKRTVDKPLGITDAALTLCTLSSTPRGACSGADGSFPRGGITHFPLQHQTVQLLIQMFVYHDFCCVCEPVLPVKGAAGILTNSKHWLCKNGFLSVSVYKSS